MPWVKLDDRFPSHRKISLLSDRAFRLYVSALCWSSENLTEGLIRDRELSVVARIRGIKGAAKELEEAQLWDRGDGGWQIHDFLEYNPDRAKVKAEREANAARQQAWRDRKRAEKEAKKAAEEAARNAPRNGVTHDAAEPENDTTATATRHDCDTNARETDWTKQQSPQVSAFRNGVSNGTPTRPVLPSPSEKEKEVSQLATPADSAGLSRIGDRPRIPEVSRPLVDKITAQGMPVGWDLQPGEWFLIEVLIQRCGIDALAISAAGSWQGARTQPRSGRYFIPAWRALSDAPELQQDQPNTLPAAVGQVVPFAQPRPSTTDARVQSALDLGRLMQAEYDAAQAAKEAQ